MSVALLARSRSICDCSGAQGQVDPAEPPQHRPPLCRRPGLRRRRLFRRASAFKTPNLDRLARKGTRFTSFYVAQAVCTASRAALMTGCYSNSRQPVRALNHESNVGIAEVGAACFPKCSKPQATPPPSSANGIWAIAQPFLPTSNGFDEFLGLPYSNDNGPLHPIVRTHSQPAADRRRTRPPSSIPISRSSRGGSPTGPCSSSRRTRTGRSFCTCRTSCRTCRSLRRRSSAANRAAGLYGDVIEELDSGIGEVLAAIKRNGLDEQTLVHFLLRQRAVPVLRQSRRLRRPAARRKADDVRRRRARAVHHALAGADSRRPRLRRAAQHDRSAADDRQPGRRQAAAAKDRRRKIAGR